jgi:hypothetical protein
MKNISLTFVLFLTATLLCGTWSYSSARPFINNDSLIAFYPFNGNANDESGNNHNGSVVGAILTNDRFNQSGKAYNFLYNGFSSDRIEVSGTSDFNFATGGFSISAWIKFSGVATTGNNYPVFSKHICGEQSGYILMLYNGKLTFWLAGSGAYNVVSTSDDYTDNSWHQVVAVYDGVTQFIYVDGELKNSMPFNYNTFNSANWALGGYNGCNGGFNGKVDEIKVFSQALTGVEIQNMYKKSANDLVVFLPFNGDAIDESGNGHDGTVYGGVLTEDRNNNANSAFTFPYLHNQIVLANTATIDLQGGFTLNAWVKYLNVNSGIVGKHYCLTSNGFLLGIEDGQFTLWISNGGWQIIKTNETYQENNWYMVTAVYDSLNKTGLIYIDGKLKASGNAIYTNFNTASFTISESSGTCPSGNMPGAVDEVKIYNRPLSAAEILTSYFASQVGLVAFYPFNTSANDASGNMNNGIVSNVVLTTDRYGEANKSFMFNGIDSYIEGINPGNNLPVGNSPRTIAGWIKNYSYQQWGSNIYHYGTKEAAPTNFHLLITGVLGLGNGYGYGVTYGNKYLIDSTWHFVAGVYEGGSTRNAKVFVDGKPDTEGALSTEPNTVLGSNWRIGRFMEGSTNFNGNIDDLRVYNIALTNQEINDLYLNETTAPVLQQPANQTTVTTSAPIMQWNSTFTNAEYKLQLASDSEFTESLYETTTTNSAVQMPEGLLSVGITYYWRIRTTLNGETGPWSEVWTFTYLNTGIQEAISGLPSLTVTPNPADLYVKFNYSLPVTLAGNRLVTIEIVNSIGKPIATLLNLQLPPDVYETRFDTHRLESGVYFCRLKAGNHVLIRKLVVLH